MLAEQEQAAGAALPPTAEEVARINLRDAATRHLLDQRRDIRAKIEQIQSLQLERLRAQLVEVERLLALHGWKDPVAPTDAELNSGVPTTPGAPKVVEVEINPRDVLGAA